MSAWYYPSNEDIEVDRSDKCVNILVMSNDYGNVYISLSFDEIKRIAIDAGLMMPFTGILRKND